MKKHILTLTAIASATMILLASCRDKGNDPTPDPDPDPKEEVITLSGSIETQTLTADKKYLLSGQVFVKDGKTLTIEPGTIILGEKKSKGTLVVERGGKIMAEGTQEKPIIFTSNQEVGDRDRGDWGGIVLLGKAKVNIPNPSIEGIEPQVHYGGNDDNDNTGVMEFVRVEFAGIELTPNNETNGITLGGVGRGTKFEHIMVSYGGDDGIEWFGGSVNGKYLIVFGTWDDCFDIDNGFSGHLQFGLSVRYPSYADQSDSNGFEWDTNGTNESTDQPTTTVVSNFTILGPSIDGNSYSANYKYGLDLRRRVAANLYNSVVLGFPSAVRMNQNTVFPIYDGGDAEIANNIFYAKTNKTVSGNGDVSTDDILTYLTDNDNTVEAGGDGNPFQKGDAYTALGINPNLFFAKKVNTQYPAHPNFAVTSGTVSSGAKFTYSKVATSSYIDKSVSFRGAFGSTDWTQGWTNFDPINVAY